MELFGGLPLPLALALLALLDGLSVGTLLIPVFLLLAPGRVRSGRIVIYLVTIAGFYLLVGLLFLWGLVNIADIAADFLASPAGQITRLLIGVALLITSFLIPTKGESDARQTEAAAGAAGSAGATDSASAVTTSRGGRLTRWRTRLLDPRTRTAAIMAVALAAGLVEVATMLPYLVGMTMLAETGVDTGFRVAALVGYCALMIAPALVLLVLRLVAAPLVQRPLERLATWMERSGAETTAWIIGIIGFLIARAAATELGLFAALAELFGN